MESYEATKQVFSKIQNLDPKNASRIMGYILINYTEKDMIRLALAPQELIVSTLNKAIFHLGFSSNTSCAPLTGFHGPTGSNPIAISRPNPLPFSPNSVLNLPSPSEPSLWAPNGIPFSPNGSTQGPSCGPNEDDFGVFEDPFGKSFDLCEKKSDCFGDDLKPCVYYAEGFCKNGGACKFVHGDLCDNGDKFDVFEQQFNDDFFGSNFGQQQRFGAPFKSNGVNLPHNKLNFVQSEAQRSAAAAALMMDEEFHKLNRVRMARNEFAGLNSDPSSRQIYLTFPADSTFKEEDVSSYFNLYGPVQDVRIPYQQKRMFGFVTFLYPETVKLILAKGNPHFVCDSRVLVKPYKEKGKLPDKKQHLHPLERGEFSYGSSPIGAECRDPYDFHFGGRMPYSTKELLFRKKMEDAHLKQAVELHRRKLMSLQLLDLKNYRNQHNASVGSPVLSPSLAQPKSSPMLSNGFASHVFEDSNGSPAGVSYEQVGAERVKESLIDCNGSGQSNEDDNKPKIEQNELSESESGVEHILPDNLFASSKKSDSNQRSSLFLKDFDNSAAVGLPASSSVASSELPVPTSSLLSLAPHKSCFFQTPRLSTGQGALGS